MVWLAGINLEHLGGTVDFVHGALTHGLCVRQHEPRKGRDGGGSLG